MSKNSASAPAAPDPYQTAQAQTQSNVATARVQGRMNRNNVINPYYTSTWKDMGDPTRNADGTPKDQPPAVEGSPSGPRSNSPTASQSQAYNPQEGQQMTQERWDSMTPEWRAQNPQLDPGGSGSKPGSSTGGRRADGTYDPNDPLAGEQDYYNQDRWQQEITLNPEEQKILDQSRRLQLGVGGLAEGQLPRIQKALDTTVDFSGLPERSTGVDYSKLQSVDPTFARGNLVKSLSGVGNNIQTGLPDAGPIQRGLDVNGQWSYDNVGGPNRTVSPIGWADQLQGVSDASYNQAKSRLDPQWEQAENDFKQHLADRGVPEGSADWQKQVDDFQRGKTDAYQTAQNNATLAGNQLLSTLGGLELSKFGAENQAQGQEFAQTGQQREDLFSQALRSGEFGNAAQAMAFGQGLDSAKFNNEAQGQLFGQDLAGAKFANDAQQQDFGQNLQQQQLAMQLRQQGLTEQQVQAALAEAARTGGYNERMAVRNQPLTDAQLLMGMAA